MSALDRLRGRLDGLRQAGRPRTTYSVPRLWLDPSRAGGSTRVDPLAWWSELVRGIERAVPSEPSRGDGWTQRAAVYSLFVRTAAAFDHDGDGKIAIGDVGGYRETGTFVKAIALLPYVRRLGCNTVHLLPIAAIGTDGRKGLLGSPYAARDPYRLDEELAEPALGLGAEDEFAAFVEAAHRLGLRVVVEFALRTAAKDSAWAAVHPDWFYWVREDASIPVPRFAEDDLREIKRRVASGVRADLPPPTVEYRSQFVRPEDVRDVVWERTRWIGRTPDGTRVRIPGAFSDWPPDDAQPAWTDVTYLRMYRHPDFDYMAYNSLRMYDARLDSAANAIGSLWDRVAGIIPDYQDRFGIDGALLDMGHALPRDLKARVIREARSANRDFAFWDEEFAPSEHTREEGYAAAVGNLWWMVHRPQRFRDEVLGLLEERGSVLPTLATPETHNTPRCAARDGGLDRSRLTWILACFLPAVPFVHAGFDLGETEPVNTGLDFSADEIARRPPETLGLYNPVALAWETGGPIIEAIRGALAVRSGCEDLITDPSPGTVWVPRCEDDRIVGYVRSGTRRAVLVVGRFGGTGGHRASLDVPLADGLVTDPLTGRTYRVSDRRITVALAPWEAVVAIGRPAAGR